MATGIVRTITLDIVTNQMWDVTWELDTGWIWTIIELNLAIIAASAPALKSFFQHCLIEPTISLYKRVRTPGWNIFCDDDGIRMENGLFGCIGEKEEKGPKTKKSGGLSEVVAR